MPTANRVRRRRNSGSNDEPSPPTLNVPRPYPSMMPRSSSTSRLIGMLSTSPNDVTNLPQLASISPPLIHAALPSMPILQPVTNFDLRPALPSTSNNRDLSLIPQRNAISPAYLQLENKNDIAKLISRSKPMLLIESLILLICQQREPDPSRQISLFNSVCSELEGSGLLGSSYKIDVLYQIRRMFGSHMHQLINNKLTQVGRNTSVLGDRQITSPSTSSSDALYDVDLHENGRYRKYFIQKSLMNQGGFGKVYQSTYTFDMVDYAIKVISFTVNNSTDTSKVLKEVQVYANLPPHLNVVGYKTAWLEMETSPQISSNTRKRELNDTVASVATPSSSGASQVGQSTSDDSTSDSTSTKTNSPSFTSFTSTGNCSFPSKCERLNQSSSQSDDIIFIKGDSSRFSSNLPLDDMHTQYECSSGVQITELPDSPVTNDSLCTVFANRAESPTVTTGGSKKTQRVSHPTSPVANDSRKIYVDGNEATFAAGIVSTASKINNQGPIIKLYIQMELCRNENLKKWIKKRNKRLLHSLKLPGDGALPYDEYVTVIEMFKQIVTGVDFLHHNNLIHRDLKPQNILFDLASGSVLKIGDFGLATLNDKSVHVCDLAHDEDGACDHGCLSHTTSSLESLQLGGDVDGQNTKYKHTAGLGTAIYVAPEQKSTNNYNNKADMYSLGIILLELLCPFNTDSEKAKVIEALKKDRIIPSTLLQVYPSASRLILSLTSVKPSERPSASELLRSHDIFPSAEQQILHLKDQLNSFKLENTNLINQNQKLEATIRDLKAKLDACNH